MWELVHSLNVPQPLKIVVKDTQENQFFMDYCNEGNLTLRLNAVGCNNAIKVLDVRISITAGLRLVAYTGASGSTVGLSENTKYATSMQNTGT